MTNVGSKTFKATDDGDEGRFDVERNVTEYTGPEEGLVNIAFWGPKGYDNLKLNAVTSTKETKALIKHLQAIVDENEAVKPREKTVPERIEELSIGTIFSIDKNSAILFVRTVGGTRQVAGIGSWANDKGYPFSDFRGWDSLDVRLDPTK